MLSKLISVPGTVMAFAVAVAAAGSSSARAQVASVTAQPAPAGVVASYFVDPAGEPPVRRDEFIAQLRRKVKYVFVIFNENHSFDNEFGTFPGANGLFADAAGPREAALTPGFSQTYTDTN